MNLSKPELISSLNLLKFKWKNGVGVELHRLTDSSKAEIWVRYYENGNKPLLVGEPTELNLLASRSREEFYKYLKSYLELPDFSWKEAFQWIVPMALETHRKGADVIELGKPDQVMQRPSWDAYPFVVTGMPNIFFGDRGSLKSKLMFVLALVMMLPWDDNELGITAPKKKLTVLKLDYEATQDADTYEWHRLLRGIDMEGAIQLKYRSCRRPLADDVEAISAHADACKADVLLVDSLGPAAGGDLNASEPALRLNNALRQLGRTSIIPAHTAKNPQSNRRTVFGNSFYENLARNIWEVTKEEGEEDESPLQHIVLSQTKSPPFAPHHKPVAFEWDFDEESERTIVRKYDINKIESIQLHASTTSVILSVLKEGMKSDREIAEETGKRISDIRVALTCPPKTIPDIIS